MSPTISIRSNDEFYRRVFEGIESESHGEVIDNFEKLVRAMIIATKPTKKHEKGFRGSRFNVLG